MNATATVSRSAIPAWLLEALPRWFKDRPAFTEAMWAGGCSLVYATAPIVGVLYGAASADGQGNTVAAFVGYIHAHLFGVLMGYVFGGGIAGVRSTQAATKAAAATPQKEP